MITKEDIIASRDDQWRQELRNGLSAKERTAIPRVEMPHLNPEQRVTCSEEVNSGLNGQQAVTEATPIRNALPDVRYQSTFPDLSKTYNVADWILPLPYSVTPAHFPPYAAAYAPKKSNVKAAAFIIRCTKILWQ